MHCQMDLVTVEVVVEGTIGLYGDLPRYFSHLQKLPQHGSTTSHGEADQVTFTQDLYSINILQALQIDTRVGLDFVTILNRILKLNFLFLI